jgi:hypothetical protein
MPRRPVVVLLCLLMPSCWGGEDSVPGCDYMVEPTDCATVTPGPFRVDFGTSELEVLVGDSHRKYVMPNDRRECITSVTWTVDDATIAEASDPTTSGTAFGIASAWITGLRPGVTTVRARVAFQNGSTSDAQPGVVRVERDRAPRGSATLVEGSVTASHIIPFTAPRAGQVEVIVDWTSRPDSPLFWLFEGECAALPCPGRAIAQHIVNRADMKPLRATAALAAGPHALRVSPAAGASPGTIQYLVRLLP